MMGKNKMLNKVPVMIVLYVLIGSFFTVLLPCDISSAASVVYVDDDNTSGPWDGTSQHPYQYIQDGVDNVDTGGTIYVASGTYEESVLIEKSMTVSGYSWDNTEVTTTGSDDSFVISADHVTVSNFLVKAGDNGYGIKFLDATYCTVSEIKAMDSKHGITILRGDHNTISNCIATANSNYGISITSADDSTIQNNEISLNFFGVYISHSSNTTVTDNIINDNTYKGIQSLDSPGNSIIKNYIQDNQRGLYIEDSLGSSIYNNFFDNTVYNAVSDVGNTWSISKKLGLNIINGPYLGGNYWADYSGHDTNGDGLGETPYNIAGGNNQDNYPLTEMQTLPSLQINLHEGWNWISFNIHPDNTTINSVFGSLNGAGRYIKNLTESSTYYPENDFWWGMLEHITDGQMYEIDMHEDFTGFTISGTVIEPTTPIHLNVGWNLVAYYPQEAMSLDIALDSIKENVATVSSQTQFAVIDNESNSFVGSLTELKPGEGYKIKMREADTLVYPDGELLISAPSTVNEGESFTVTVTAQGTPIQNANVEFNNIQQLTNSQGKTTYTAPSVKSNTLYTITATNIEFISSQVQITVIPKSTTEIVPTKDSCWVYGSIYESGTSDPIENVKICFINKEDQVTISKCQFVDGAYNTQLFYFPSDSKFTIEVKKSGYITQTKEIDLFNIEYKNIDFYLDKNEEVLEKGGTSDFIVESQILNNNVGAEVDFDSINHITYYSDIEISIEQSNPLSLGGIKFKVSGEQDQGTIIVLYIYDVENPDNIVLNYDGKIIKQNTGTLTFFNSRDTETWLLLPTEVENTYVVLLNVPHFSEHTIQISSVAEVVDALGGPAAVLLYITVFAIVAVIYIAPIIFVDKKK